MLLGRAHKSPKVLEKQLTGLMGSFGHDSPDKEGHEKIPVQGCCLRDLGLWELQCSAPMSRIPGVEANSRSAPGIA